MQFQSNWKQTEKSTIAGGVTGFVMGGVMGIFGLTSAGRACGKWMQETTKLDVKTVDMVKGFWGIMEAVLDLTTNPQIALEWGYVHNLISTKLCQNIREIEWTKSYNVIKFQSYQGHGINYVR